MYCNNCETQFYEDVEGDEGNPLRIVCDGRHACCDQDCKYSRGKLIADANAKGGAFKVKVLGERPGRRLGVQDRLPLDRNVHHVQVPRLPVRRFSLR